MISKCLLVIIAITSPLFAALGSGFFLRSGVGLTGLGGSELYLPTTELKYREARVDSLMLNHTPFSGENGVIHPRFVAGWEQSLTMFLSVQGGAGIVLTGLTWKKMEVTNQFGAVDHVVNNDASLSMVYLSVPLDVKLMLPINSGGFTCSFGPRFGLLTSAQFDNRARSFTEDQYSQFHPYSLGLGGSFGGEVRLNKTDLLIELRMEGDTGNASKDESLQMSYFCLSLEAGLRFNAKRLEKPSWWPL